MILSFLKKFKKSSQLEVTNEIDFEYYAVAATDKGAVRNQNQDSVLFVKPYDLSIKNSKGCLAIVADGMGGHNSGDVASKMAVEIFTREYFNYEGDILKAQEYAFKFANKTIFTKAESDKIFSGMGTTFSAIILKHDNIFITHIGDSRIYKISRKGIHQLTKDHTYVQHLIDTKVISEKERENHPNGNVITKALGTQKKGVADIFKVQEKITNQDTILMCSDGLYEYIKSFELQTLILDNEPEDAANKLIKIAKDRGGHDNISVLIVNRQSVEKNTFKVTLEIE